MKLKLVKNSVMCIIYFPWRWTLMTVLLPMKINGLSLNGFVLFALNHQNLNDSHYIWFERNINQDGWKAVAHIPKHSWGWRRRWTPGLSITEEWEVRLLSNLRRSIWLVVSCMTFIGALRGTSLTCAIKRYHPRQELGQLSF